MIDNACTTFPYLTPSSLTARLSWSSASPIPEPSLKLHGSLDSEMTGFFFQNTVGPLQKIPGKANKQKKKQKQKGRDPWQPVFPPERIDGLSTA